MFNRLSGWDRLLQCKSHFLVCYYSYINVIYHAVRLLPDHSIRCVQKSKSKCLIFFPHGEHFIFERINPKKQSILLGKIFTLVFFQYILTFELFWITHIRSNPTQNKTKTKTFANFFCILAYVEGTLEQFLVKWCYVVPLESALNNPKIVGFPKLYKYCTYKHRN